MTPGDLPYPLVDWRGVRLTTELPPPGFLHSLARFKKALSQFWNGIDGREQGPWSTSSVKLCKLIDATQTSKVLEKQFSSKCAFRPLLCPCLYQDGRDIPELRLQRPIGRDITQSLIDLYFINTFVEG